MLPFDSLFGIRDCVEFNMKNNMKNNDNNRTDQSRRAKVQKTMQTFLLEDIIINILSRLPVRPIARFQSVCKQWRSCINDPYFLSECHTRSRNKICIVIKMTTCGQLIFYNFDRESTKHHVSFIDINLGRSPHYYLSNTVNGLTCAFGLAKASAMHLLSLDKFAAKKSDLSRSIHHECVAFFDFNRVGLGFNASIGTYKVVRLFPQDGINYSCEILTIGSLDDGKWRQIDDGKWRQIDEAPGVDCTYGSIFLHGAFHWKPRQESRIDPLALIKFDLEAEKFEVMEPMPHNNCPRSSFMGLAELENCICGSFFNEASEMDIWILKNYKKCEWCKIHSINLQNFGPDYYPRYFIGIADGVVMLKLWGVGKSDWEVNCFDIRDEVYHNLLSSN